MKYLLIILSFLFIQCIYAQSKSIPKLEAYDAVCEKNIYQRDRINERIIDYKIISDTLFLKLQVIENCAFREQLTSIKIIKDTLQISRDGEPKEFETCDCLYVIDYKISNFKIKNPLFKYKEKILKLSTNYYLPAVYTISGKDTLVVYDDAGFHYQRTFYESGKIKSLSIRKNSYGELIKYYENGSIQSIRQSFSEFDLSIEKEWDINGNLTTYKNSLLINQILPTFEQFEKGAKAILTKMEN